MTARYDRDRAWTCSCGRRGDPRSRRGHAPGCDAPGVQRARCRLRERGVPHNGHGDCPGTDFPQARWDAACRTIARGGR
jgi:hypothetical protein